jgi:hypothetical protein
MVNLEQVRRRAKERVREERSTDAAVRLTTVQHRVAGEHGYRRGQHSHETSSGSTC